MFGLCKGGACENNRWSLESPGNIFGRRKDDGEEEGGGEEKKKEKEKVRVYSQRKLKLVLRELNEYYR